MATTLNGKELTQIQESVLHEALLKYASHAGWMNENPKYSGPHWDEAIEATTELIVLYEKGAPTTNGL